VHGSLRSPLFVFDWLHLQRRLLCLQVVSVREALPLLASGRLVSFLRFQWETFTLLWNIELPHLAETALEKRLLRPGASFAAALPHVDTSFASKPWWIGVAALIGLAKPGKMEMAPPIARELLLVGGGHSHAFVIKNMGMNPEPGLSVTLISPDIETPYSGMLPGHVAGMYSREECHIDLVRLCRFGNVRFIKDTVVSVDIDDQLVRVADRTRPPIRYDVLSIDIGSSPRMVPISATPVKPISRFSSRWDALIDSVCSKTAQGNVLTLAVVGAGAGGVELTLSMQYRLEQLGANVQFALFSNKRFVCPSHNRGIQRKFLRILKERGVEVYFNFVALNAENGVLVAQDGRKVMFDECIWCTNAKTQDWMSESGLSSDDGGFVRVKPTLESENCSNVFAAGDCANMIESPRPKAGVFAVRQGPPLTENLRRAVRNLNASSNDLRLRLEMIPFEPQTSFLGLIGTGAPYCVASRGEMVLEGAWLWDLKEWIDRKWMAGYSTQLPIMIDGAQEEDKGADVLRQLEKTSAMRCGGCGAKIGKTVLDRVMQNMNPPTRPEVEVGLDAPDDCAVVKFGEDAHVVQTVDFFRSFVDDPYVFGRIAANHALSDCHAMCADPVSAMAIAVVPFAKEEIVEGILSQMMSGACETLRESECALVGGHSCEGKDLALGLSITGARNSNGRLLTKGGMVEGDIILLTKPIGTGTLFAANMRVMAKGKWIEEAINCMLQSNKDAARLALEHGATACTDVTGFGLLGHLIEMLQASCPNLQAQIDVEKVSLLQGALQCVQTGIFSSLQPQNTRLRRAVENHQEASSQHAYKYPLMYDPQTSGGLLISIPASNADELLTNLHNAGYKFASKIGKVAISSSGFPLRCESVTFSESKVTTT